MDALPPHPPGFSRRTVFTFPGQGAQHARMAAGLYGVSKTFTAKMDHAFEELPSGRTLREAWLAVTPPATYDDITHSQPLLYAVNYALGTMLTAAGLRPDILLGHSVGELAAATLAGIFTFDEGLRYLSQYVSLYQKAPRGGMLVVAATPEEAQAHLLPGVVIGALNAPRQVLLSALEPDLTRVMASLRRAGITCARIRALQPFHHPAMREVATANADALTRPLLKEPHTTMCSAYTAQELDDGTATDWQFWLNQPAEPVLFGPALQYLLSSGPYLLLEAGPGRNLTALARRMPAVSRGDSAAISLLPAGAGAPEADVEAVRASLDQFVALQGSTSTPALDF